VDKQKTVPDVVCPGCLKLMRLIAKEPSRLQGRETATFHCDECGADTKREIGLGK
jgi:hypothetical protein